MLLDVIKPGASSRAIQLYLKKVGELGLPPISSASATASGCTCTRTRISALTTASSRPAWCSASSR